MIGAAAAAAVGASELFKYNRSNYMYDRKMRQEQEFKVWEFRKVQAELWRDDIRDIIGLTEKKMDSYLIISVMQVEMCVALFVEGRLEPGTPSWLLHFYMLALAAAFMYLLLSVFLAMHAMVVAQCHSARLLTQFVRLPVPTMEQLHDLRTYGMSYESLGVGSMLRVPFTTDNKSYKEPEYRRSHQPSPDELAAQYEIAGDSAASSASKLPKEVCTDPWRLELDESLRDIYELQEEPAALRRHISLVRQAAAQYQCFDAFARVSMTFGTNQLLHAVGCYSLGYLAIQDGATWPAGSVAMVMLTMAMVMLQLDFSLTFREHLLGQSLVILSYVSTIYSTILWCTYGEDSESRLQWLLPFAYLSHGSWLLWALKVCGIEKQPNGAILPVKFRTVLYLDVFGWYAEDSPSSVRGSRRQDAVAGAPEMEKTLSREELAERQEDLVQEARWLQSQKGLSEFQRKQVEELASTVSESNRKADQLPFSARTPEIKDATRRTLRDAEDRKRYIRAFSERVEAYRRAAAAIKSQAAGNSNAASDNSRTLSCCAAPGGDGSDYEYEPIIEDDEEEDTHLPIHLHEGPAGEVRHITKKDGPSLRHAPTKVFEPSGYTPGTEEDEKHDKTVLKIGAGRIPAFVFRGLTWVLIVVWAFGFLTPYGMRRDWNTSPLSAEVVVEEFERNGDETTEEVSAMVGTDPFGLPELIPQPTKKAAELPLLGGGSLIRVAWPFHAAFIPRSLTCDSSGDRLIVTDEFSVYVGSLSVNRSADSVMRLKRTHLCKNLQGHTLQDIDVACAPGKDSECLLLALTSTESQDAEIRTCQLLSYQQQANLGLEAQPQVASSWNVAVGWLHDNEEVGSIAINPSCISNVSSELGLGKPVPFQPQRLGCVDVGTTAGRIVQLRSKAGDPDSFIPGRVLHQRGNPSSRGSLSILSNGVVLKLEQGAGAKVSTFNSTTGSYIGSWRLPEDHTWLMLCGSADLVYAFGVQEDGSHVVLYQFPAPAKLLHTQLRMLRGNDPG